MTIANSVSRITPMPPPLSKKFTLNDLRAARQSGDKVAMLTCYDFTTARLMQEAGVPMLLVGTFSIRSARIRLLWPSFSSSK